MLVSEKGLIESIEEAFADAEYPGHRLEDIAPGAYGSDAELLRAFAGKHWRNLSAKFLERHRAFEFCFLTPTAFRFYLPAYLIGSIHHPIRSKAWTDIVIYHLSPPKASGYRDEELLSSGTKDFTGCLQSKSTRYGCGLSIWSSAKRSSRNWSLRTIGSSKVRSRICTICDTMAGTIARKSFKLASSKRLQCSRKSL